jgi:hypothetical protein
VGTTPDCLVASRARPIHERPETVELKALFRDSIRRRRGLITADGFLRVAARGAREDSALRLHALEMPVRVLSGFGGRPSSKLATRRRSAPSSPVRLTSSSPRSMTWRDGRVTLHKAATATPPRSTLLPFEVASPRYHASLTRRSCDSRVRLPIRQSASRAIRTAGQPRFPAILRQWLKSSRVGIPSVRRLSVALVRACADTLEE